METLVLLARETPLPADVDLQAELGKVRPQTSQTLQAMAWFENGAVVRNEPGRKPLWDERRSTTRCGRRRSRSGRSWGVCFRTRGR